MRHGLVSYAVVTSLLALPGWAQQPGDYTIRGQDPRWAGQTIYLLPAERPRHGQPWWGLDSTQADAAGRFVLQGHVPAPDVYWLRVRQQALAQPVPLAGQSERLRAQVEQSPSSPRQAPVYLLRPSGSPEVELLHALLPYVALRSRSVPAGDQTLRRMEHLVRHQADSYLAPYLAYTYLRLHPSARPLLDSLTTRFSHQQLASPYLPRWRQVLAAPPALRLGNWAPDFTLPDLNGQPVGLRSLRGRYVRLDCWASWCGPYRAENPPVLAAYQRYHRRGAGFTVRSVSLDEQPVAWRRAVQPDALPWTQVADGQGLAGSTSQLYQLTALPATFLLDPDGHLVAQDLYGSALGQELARRLK